MVVSVSAEQWRMLQQSVPLPTATITQEDIEGPDSIGTGAPQAHTGSNPSVKAATTCCFLPALPTSPVPCLGACSHVRKLFAVFLLKEWWFSLLSEGLEVLGSP